MSDSAVWQTLIAYEQLEPGDVTEIVFKNRRLAIYDSSEGLYITQAQCSHAGAALCDGYFDGHVIECPLHQGYFDVRDGKALGAPAVKALRTYPARLSDGMVQVCI